MHIDKIQVMERYVVIVIANSAEQIIDINIIVIYNSKQCAATNWKKNYIWKKLDFKGNKQNMKERIWTVMWCDAKCGRQTFKSWEDFSNKTYLTISEIYQLRSRRFWNDTLRAPIATSEMTYLILTAHRSQSETRTNHFFYIKQRQAKCRILHKKENLGL